MIFVKPKKGLRVRHPENPSAHIESEGAWVNETTQLQRLINDGDLVVDKHKTESEHPTNSKTKATHTPRAKHVDVEDEGDDE